jgi:hypothetical protein
MENSKKIYMDSPLEKLRDQKAEAYMEKYCGAHVSAIRIEKPERYRYQKIGFQAGWNAYESLGLAVKFLDWCAHKACWKDGIKGWYSMTMNFEKLLGKEYLTTEELYQYWLENIYKSENEV